MGRGLTVSACKTYNSVYGGIYSVKVLITKAATTPAYTYNVADFNGITNAVSQSTVSTAYYAGTVAAMTINMSVVNLDKVVAEIAKGRNGYEYMIVPGPSSLGRANVKSINNITNC